MALHLKIESLQTSLISPDHFLPPSVSQYIENSVLHGALETYHSVTASQCKTISLIFVSFRLISNCCDMLEEVSCHGDDIRRDDSQWDDTTGTIARQTTYHGDDSHRDDI